MKYLLIFLLLPFWVSAQKMDTLRFDSIHAIPNIPDREPGLVKKFLFSISECVLDSQNIYFHTLDSADQFYLERWKNESWIRIVHTSWVGVKQPHLIPMNLEGPRVFTGNVFIEADVERKTRSFSGIDSFLYQKYISKQDITWGSGIIRFFGAGSYRLTVMNHPTSQTVWWIIMPKPIKKTETVIVTKKICSGEEIPDSIPTVYEKDCKLYIVEFEEIDSIPTKILSESFNPCDKEIRVTVTEPFDQILWSNGSTKSFSFVKRSDTISVTLKRKNFCDGTAFFITPPISPECNKDDKEEECKGSIYIPNAFSPNADGVNDIFMIFFEKNCVSQIRSFKVFDRWGGNLYEKYNFPPNNLGYGWDGTARGIPLNPATFIWFAEVVFSDGQIKHYEGGIALIR